MKSSGKESTPPENWSRRLWPTGTQTISLKMSKKQQAAGATFIDVNAGARIGHEEEDMRWLLDTIQPVCDIPLALDSPDPAILEMAFAMGKADPHGQLHLPGKKSGSMP